MKIEKNPPDQKVAPQDCEVVPGRERSVVANPNGDEPLGDQPVGTGHEDEYQD